MPNTNPNAEHPPQRRTPPHQFKSHPKILKARFTPQQEVEAFATQFSMRIAPQPTHKYCFDSISGKMPNIHPPQCRTPPPPCEKPPQNIGGQVHPTARSGQLCYPIFNANRASADPQVLLRFHFGKKHTSPPLSASLPTPQVAAGKLGLGPSELQVSPTQQTLNLCSRPTAPNALSPETNMKITNHPKTNEKPGSPHSKKWKLFSSACPEK
jgi:hypothetical protein